MSFQRASVEVRYTEKIKQRVYIKRKTWCGIFTRLHVVQRKYRQKLICTLTFGFISNKRLIIDILIQFVNLIYNKFLSVKHTDVTLNYRPTIRFTSANLCFVWIIPEWNKTDVLKIYLVLFTYLKVKKVFLFERRYFVLMCLLYSNMSMTQQIFSRNFTYREIPPIRPPIVLI